MPQTKEEKNEYNRLHYLKNKEKIKEQHRLHYLENKEKIRERVILYRLENKEELIQKQILYRKSPNGIKSRRISHWRFRGVKDNFNDNFETIYNIYESTKYCDECKIELNIEGDDRTRKCLDHCHTSGYFRNILCQSCNIRRV